MKKKSALNRFYLLTLLGIAIVLVLTFVHNTTADGYDLPPRGTEPSDIVPVSQTSNGKTADGARLQIHALFSQSWPWDEMHWQNVWTTIEWNDGQGNWYSVAGWQGGLDAIAQEEVGWVGFKEWWAGENDLGTGPFRWKIYQNAGGPLLVTSEPFYLPELAGSTMVLQPILEAK